MSKSDRLSELVGEVKQPPIFLSEASVKFIPTPLQARILEIAKELMQEHYLLDGDQLYSRCVRLLKDIDKKELDQELMKLYRLKILVNGKALTRENLCENQHRVKLLELVKVNPGSNLNKISNLMPLNRGTIKWHLKMLEKFDLIRSETIENQLVFFDFFIDKRLSKIYYILNKKAMLDILDCISKNFGITANELTTRIGLPRSTIFRKIKVMIENGFLQTFITGNQLVIQDFSPQYKGIITEFILKNRNNQ